MIKALYIRTDETGIIIGVDINRDTFEQLVGRPLESFRNYEDNYFLVFCPDNARAYAWPTRYFPFEVDFVNHDVYGPILVIAVGKDETGKDCFIDFPEKLFEKFKTFGKLE